MTGAQEREAFSHRLRMALDRAGWRAIGATLLAREFNRRSAGHPITAHATRKWLQGEAIPAQGNLQELAHWLEVPAPWLRFGEPSGAVQNGASPPPRASETPPSPYAPDRAARLMSDFTRLTQEQQRVVEALIGVLLNGQDPPSDSH